MNSRGTDDTAPAGIAETLPAEAATPIDSGAALVGEASLATAPIAVPGYVVGSRLGAGGFGEVFRAKHEVIGREVAIKVLHERYSGDAEAIGRFMAEARAVGKMSHPGIVDLFEFGRLPDGRHFAVMELIGGRTLRDVLRERGRLPLAAALPILRSMAEAIDAAHAAGIAHRDLKPDNVFVVDAERGVTKLIDFGLAKLTDEVAITQTGSVFGTPLYMSPEQCRGKGVDTRTDCYSFGALAYHVLTGSPPFTGTDALALALQHLNESPEPASKRVPELAGRVDRVLAAMLAKDPAERPMPIATAIAALDDGELPKPPRRPAFVRRHRGKLAVAAAALAIAVVAGVRFTSSAGGSDVGPECVLSAERLDGIWDPLVRARLAGHFARVDRPDVASASRHALRDLDELATAWSKQWDAACHGSEKQTDPLLYAQRQNCLERTLVDLRGVVVSTFAAEPGSFAAGWIPGTLFTWSTPIADCARTETLRAMPAAPRSEQRQEVAELMTRLRLARVEMRAVHNARAAGDEVKANARLDDVVVRLVALDVAAAAEAAMMHSWYAHSIAEREPAHLPAARRSSERAIELARRLGDDRVLALCYQFDARRALTTHDVALAEDLLRRAREAHERSGRSAAISSFAEELVGIALEKHDWNAAVAAARADGDLNRSVPALLQLGRGDEAIVAARSRVDREIASRGSDNWIPAEALVELALVHYQLGNFRHALERAREALATYERIRSLPSLRSKAAAIQLAAIHRLGLPGLEVAATTALAMRFPESSKHLWLNAAQIGRWIGNCELVALALARVPPSLEHDQVAFGVAANCELIPQLEQIAKRLIAANPYRVPSSFAEVAVANTLAALGQAVVDARSGRVASALAYLERNRPAHTMSDGAGAHLAMMIDAQVLVELRRWKEARALLERAAKRDRNDQRFVDHLSWGRALLETGDAAGAVPHLESALAASFVNEGANLPGASFALARALWESGGDRERARRLAAQAIRTYSTFHEGERRVTQTWLDTRR